MTALVLMAALTIPSPTPGPWVGPPVSGHGARALVRFTVDPGSGLVQPVIRFRSRRCGRAGRVSLGLVAVNDGRFKVRARGLRLTGRFESTSSAQGSLGGRVTRRCRLPHLRWTATTAVPPPVAEEPEPVSDEELVDGEELDFEEDIDRAANAVRLTVRAAELAMRMRGKRNGARE
jgi:hypothetical protein